MASQIPPEIRSNRHCLTLKFTLKDSEGRGDRSIQKYDAQKWIKIQSTCNCFHVKEKGWWKEERNGLCSIQRKVWSW